MLAETGLSCQTIAKLLNWDYEYLRRVLVKNLIEKRYPDLELYSHTGGKLEPGWEDLQYYLLGMKILRDIYNGVPKQQILSDFKTPINPEGISTDVFDSVCKRVLGGLYQTLINEARDILLSIIIYDINPKSQGDIY